MEQSEDMHSLSNQLLESFLIPSWQFQLDLAHSYLLKLPCDFLKTIFVPYSEISGRKPFMLSNLLSPLLRPL